MTAPAIILDSSVLINVLATKQTPAILGAFGNVGICAAVEQETIFLRGERPNDPPEPILLAPFVADGLIERYDLRTDEEELFVNLAVDLDDGEAMTMAIAYHRRMKVAIDDRKARRIAMERLASLVLLRTTDIIHAWNQTARPDRQQLRNALQQIRDVARYQPSRDDPLREWWSTAAT
jgi:predicted nucleic acid-binding protein